MIDLNIFDAVSQQQDNEQVQRSSLVQKVAKEAVQQQSSYQIPEEFQGIIDNINAEREQQLIQDRMNVFNNYVQQMACGGCIKHGSGGSIHIDPSKKGTFTAAASRHGMGVQAFASKVLAHKENYSPAMVKKANFARNASKWHAEGGPLNLYSKGGYIEDGLRARGVTGFRVTSGYRGPNSKVGHAGKRSGHARYLGDGKSSGAIDIVPTDKSPEGWARLEQQLRRPEVEEFIRGEIGGTILSETDPATMRKTGATGPHYHIGLGVAGDGNFYGHNHSTVPRSASSRVSGASMPVIPFSSSSPMMAMTPMQEEPVQPEAPWWGSYLSTPQQASSSVSASPFGEDYSFLDLAWNPMTGANEPTTTQSSFPNLFAEGGPVNVYRSKGRMTRSKAKPLKVGETLAGSRVDTDQCAKFANDYVRSQGYMQNGDAWNSSGISTVFSGYDGLERPSAYDAAAVAAYNNAASDNVLKNFDSSTLDPERLYTVNMYFRGSPYQEEAFNNGTKGRTGTHTGYLQNQDGQWYVVHNIHGKVHIDPFSSIQGGGKGWGITGIYAPRKDNLWNRGITKLGFADGGYLMPIHCYADGGAYNDDFMKYYGLSWAPASHIYTSDPYWREIQEHDSKGMYAVDSDGYYVPASKMKSYWDAYQSLPSKPVEPVITPNEQTEATLSRFRSAVPDSRLRNGLSDYLSRFVGNKSQDEIINSYLDLHERYGSPKYGVAFGSRAMTPYVAGTYIGRQLTDWLGLGDIALGKQEYDPTLATEYRRLMNKMPAPFRGSNGVETGRIMMDEFPHYVQYHKNEQGQRLSDNAPRSLWTGFFPDFESLPGTGIDAYNDYGNTEYQAHGPIKAGLMSRITGKPVNRFIHRHNNEWYSKNTGIFDQPIDNNEQLDDYLWNSTQSASRFAGDQYRKWVSDGTVTPVPSFEDGTFGNLWDAVHYPYALKNSLFYDFLLPERKQ